MKNFLLIPFLLSFHMAYAGTGSAKDVNLILLIIIALFLFILAVFFSIDFVRKMNKKRKEKEITHLADKAETENIS